MATQQSNNELRSHSGATWTALETLKISTPCWDSSRTERVLQAAHKKRRQREVTRGLGAALLCATFAAVIFLKVAKGQDHTTTSRSSASQMSQAQASSADPASKSREPKRRAVPSIGKSTASQEDKLDIQAPSVWAPYSDEAHAVGPWHQSLDISAAEGHSVVQSRETQRFPHSGHSAASSLRPSPPMSNSTLANKGEQRGVSRGVSRRRQPKIHALPLKPREKTTPWRVRASRGDFSGAYDALTRPGTDEIVRDRIEELLLAADVARLSHHPAAAVPHLSRVVSKYSSDPRAALAAFTLGRVQLEDLKQPRAAAHSFLKVLQLAPEGALAQDALAREVEAWAKAGDLRRAKLRGQEYLLKYPRGRRLEAVRHFSRL